NMFQNNIQYVQSEYEENNNIDVSSIPWEYLESKVNATVHYHISIIEVVTDLEDIFSNAMFSIYIFTLTILCFEVYRAATV
ncbi:hypothetical protein ILUMI_09547, partial [Ignelater luminosus]